MSKWRPHRSNISIVKKGRGVARRRNPIIVDLPTTVEVLQMQSVDKVVNLSLEASYVDEIAMSTIMTVADFVSQSAMEAIPIARVSKRLNNLSPEVIGKSLITLEQKGLVSLDPVMGTVEVRHDG